VGLKGVQKDQEVSSREAAKLMRPPLAIKEENLTAMMDAESLESCAQGLEMREGEDGRRRVSGFPEVLPRRRNKGRAIVWSKKRLSGKEKSGKLERSKYCDAMRGRAIGLGKVPEQLRKKGPTDSQKRWRLRKKRGIEPTEKRNHQKTGKKHNWNRKKKDTGGGKKQRKIKIIREKVLVCEPQCVLTVVRERRPHRNRKKCIKGGSTRGKWKNEMTI